jgi:chromosome partitioning protein
LKTITVLSRKGGAGKTTVAVSLALAARQAGLKVILVDTDPLRSAAEVVRSRREAAALLFESAPAKLFVVQDACRQNGCDLLIVDTPTAPEADVLRAINVSDLCLAVARPTALDIAAIRQSIDLIQRAGAPGLVVLNQCPPLRGGEETLHVRQAVERLHFSRLPVANARLRSRAAYQHAFIHSCGVTEWDPASDAAGDVLRLLAEISDQLMLQRPQVTVAPHRPRSALRQLLDHAGAFRAA